MADHARFQLSPILIVLWTGPFDLVFAGVAILFIIWMCAFLMTLVMAVLSARVHRWRHALSLLVLPIATLIVVANADCVWLFAIETGEIIHFQAMGRSYLEDVSKLPSAGEPHLRYGNGVAS